MPQASHSSDPAEPDSADSTSTEVEPDQTPGVQTQPPDAVQPVRPTHVLQAAKEEPFPLADPGEYYDGMWSGIPNYKCPYCSYAVLRDSGGSGAVELHILAAIDQGRINHFKALVIQKEELA